MPKSIGARWTTLFLAASIKAGEDNRNVARMALLLAGLPKEVPGATVNGYCGSSLECGRHRGTRDRLGETSLMIAAALSP